MSRETGETASSSELIAGAQLTECRTLVELIRRAIVDEPPLAMKEGGIIRDGFDHAPRRIAQRASAAARIGSRNCSRTKSSGTGIASLKVRFNSVFGYYIEVTKSNLDKVPAHYMRKQTIANGERFITPELKEMEGKILGAEERSVKLEYELFQACARKCSAQLKQIQQHGGGAGATRCAGVVRGNRAAVQLLPAAGWRRGVSEDSRWTASGAGTKSERRAVCAERYGRWMPSRRRRKIGPRSTGPEHGGQEHLYPAGGAARVAGAYRVVHSGGGGASRFGGSHFHAHRRER